MESEKVILIRIGEIFLKGDNKFYFENVLKENIKKTLKSFNYKFEVLHNRYLISNYIEDDEYAIIDRLNKVFGIHSISISYKIQTNITEISTFIANKIDKKKGTFRVTVNRVDKKININSIEIASLIGSEIIAHNPDLKVDLFNYDHEISVDIRENGYTFIFFKKILMGGGLPSGVSGKGLLLLSGGIDSPVAGYLVAKRGMKLDALHFHSFPFTGQHAQEKVIELAKIVKCYSLDMNLYFVKLTDIQKIIKEKCPKEFMITILRRYMMKIATKISEIKKCDAIITGESLGQVASQTVESLFSTSHSTDKLILRPLICYDKSEIIEVAKKIGSFETSILPFEDCCTIFLPKNPIIHPKINKVLEVEKLIMNENELITEAISGLEKISM